MLAGIGRCGSRRRDIWVAINISFGDKLAWQWLHHSRRSDSIAAPGRSTMAVRDTGFAEHSKLSQAWSFLHQRANCELRYDLRRAPNELKRECLVCHLQSRSESSEFCFMPCFRKWRFVMKISFFVAAVFTTVAIAGCADQGQNRTRTGSGAGQTYTTNRPASDNHNAPGGAAGTSTSGTSGTSGTNTSANTPSGTGAAGTGTTGAGASGTSGSGTSSSGPGSSATSSGTGAGTGTGTGTGAGGNQGAAGTGTR